MTVTTHQPARLLKACAIAIALLAPFLIYFDTARSIVFIWNSSETFAHGYIILPISLWLIWSRRNTFMHLAPAPCWPALLLLALCGCAWLAATLGGVQFVRQYMFAAMIPLAALTVLGTRISSQIAFPLLFILFAVPFGEVFIEPLINFTADFTVAAVQATGIPILREGSSFSLPTGNWSVVEACSGVRYLISSFTLGCLFAYLTYRSRVRQLMFVLLSIIVPIIANGLRAFMIVMIGHFSGMQLAVGVDHLIYGWLFFGLVMFLMFWIGNLWREDQHDVPTPATAGVATTPVTAASALQLFGAAFGVVVCIGMWPAYAGYIEKTGFNPTPVDLSSFRSTWQESPPFADWKPAFYPASADMHRFFRRDKQTVGTSVLYYRNQHRGAELISSANRLAVSEDPLWHRNSTSLRHETLSNRTLAIRESMIKGAAGSLLVWHWYWIDGQFTTNEYLGKILQAKQKFLLRGDDGASVMIFAPYTENPDEARSALRNFLTENLLPLETTLAANTSR